MSYHSHKYDQHTTFFCRLHPEDDYWEKDIHVHTEEELLLLLSPGGSTVISNGVSYHIPTPAFVWNRAGSYHVVKDTQATTDSHLGVFRPNFLDEVPQYLQCEPFAQDLSLFALPLTSGRAQRLKEMFHMIQHSPLIQRKLLLPCLFHQISNYLSTGTKPICAAKTHNYIWDVVVLLQESFREKITIEELADRFHVGQTKLKSDFKKITNLTVHAFRLRVQLQNARSKLATTELSLSQIALECGFTDQSHLIRAFRAEYGMTPGAFRKKYTESPRWKG